MLKHEEAERSTSKTTVKADILEIAYNYPFKTGISTRTVI